MSYELIISEKPNAAKKLASALADGKALKEMVGGVPVYKVTNGSRDLVIACAVGHLFGVAEKEKSFKYPSFDIHWVPTSSVDKTSSYSKKYASAIQKMAKDATEFTVACDYDMEGEVIGLNVIRHLCHQKDANRMKFSTLTTDELREAYENKQRHLDWGQANAGETRHFLDWLYGINLSRALMTAVKNAGSFKILSSGRVQGPALKIIVDRERQIQSFKPVPYWQLELHSTQGIISMHKEDKFFDQAKATAVFDRCKGADALVDQVDKKEFEQAPPTPFDLGSLQTESYRLFGISPKLTLQIAQNLYLEGATSYPRTSSQQLPKSIGYEKILKGLSTNPIYKVQTSFLLALPALLPCEGKKTDPAHPAIYPTGLPSKTRNERERKVYDLIVRRFFAVFGTPALRQTVSVTLLANDEPFIAKGTTTLSPGWHLLYQPYVRLKEEELPDLHKGQVLATEDLLLLSKETAPPKRYTPSSIISELEKRSLGTKATRADIVDNLYKRGYVDEKSITATELGIRTIETLEKFCPEIIDEELTRSFEEEMEQIRQNTRSQEQVLEHAKEELTKILGHFKKNEGQIGKDLIIAHRESEDTKNTLGSCPVCKEGFLKIMYSPKTKRKFIGCSRYPQCSTSAPLPMGALIKKTDKLCEHDGWPLVLALRRGKKPQQLCLNLDCPGKANPEARAKAGSPCPACGKPLEVKRSLYGEFIGCSAYPKCKHTQNGSAPTI